jgi:hypothetical protein
MSDSRRRRKLVTGPNKALSSLSLSLSLSGGRGNVYCTREKDRRVRRGTRRVVTFPSPASSRKGFSLH